MREEENACRGGAWRVRPQAKRKILTRLEMTKNGAEPGRSKTRNSHHKALQTIPEGIHASAAWTLIWTKGPANESEAELWLRADAVPCVQETTNEDKTTKVKVRSIAFLCDGTS